jgi:hypothetical protein
MKSQLQQWGLKLSKPRNPVAKFLRRYNKAKVFIDRKREAKKNGELIEEQPLCYLSKDYIPPLDREDFIE